ncbi:GAF domain-containing protein [Enterovirga sp.]|uniref:GAF domain-containing protein n=1 Tax=Enterovirga sp. TaxID=2026350 RepID=UPI00262A9650|nr:GAF domain-containing protein [Enterovirga sp.]MDB5592701.1 hypothetical protein [Enterovirga sp.]
MTRALAAAPSPCWTETERLAALASYGILDTPREAEFDDVVKLASQICRAPIAFINFVSDDRQWFKAELGLGIRETRLDVSICAHAILQPGVFVVPDLSQDERFACNPLVTGTPKLRFYAGALLEADAGQPLGTVCVLDYEPRPTGLTAEQHFALEVLAKQVMAQLNLRRAVRERDRALAEQGTGLERARLVAAATNDAIWDWDLLQDNVVWNEVLHSAYGHTLSDATSAGGWWVEHLHPEDRERVHGSIDAAIAGDAMHWREEYRFSRADGSYAEVFDRGSLIRDPSGRAVRMIGAMLDVTERRQAVMRANAFAELSERLRDMEDTALMAYTAAEIMGRALGVGRAGYGTVDPEQETVTIERDWTMPGVPSLAGKLHFRDFGTYIEDLKRGETVVFADAEIDPRTAAGADALKSINARSVVNLPVTEHGKFVAIFYLNHGAPRAWPEHELAFVRDVADRTRLAVERRRAELALRSANDRLTFLDLLGREVAKAVDAAAVMATTTRMAGEYMRVSACAYADMDADEDGFTIRGGWSARGSRSIVGRYRLRDFGTRAVRELGAGRPLIINDHLTELEPEEAGAFHNIGGSATICMPLVKEGRLTALMAVHDRKPRIWTEDELATIREVTDRSWAHIERVRAQAELRASAETLREFNETLESRVEERTRQLMEAEEQLRQAQKMEAVGQLTGGIAHDFNNLLTGIVGSLDLMQTRMAQGRTENLERYTKAAMSSANRAAALTHRLLAFARRQPLDPKPVDANVLVTSLEDLLRRTIGELIGLEIVTAGGLWPTLCDPHQLESALLNLAINARDAMPDGGKLTIETCNTHLDRAYAAQNRDVVPGQYICVCVTDTGVGMPPEVIARAFDPFYTTKPIGQGTGLGLSMVYGFARQSEGHARIYSEPGQGTTVKIYLPRHRGTVLAEEPPPIRTGAHPPGSGETVLVVEDEPVVRDLVVEVLHDLGYQALEAIDGPSGLAVLQSGARVDLLVTDVGLPGLNGRQLADHARLTRPDLRVLFITGYAENAALASGFLEPGMEMITKPFPVDALASRIRQMIES